MAKLKTPNNSVADAPSFRISVDGKELNRSYDILSIVTKREINKIPSAKVVLKDGNVAESGFEISDTEYLIPGKKIAIEMGREDNYTDIFKGIITKHAVKVQKNGNANLHIECQDETTKMTLGKKSKYHENLKDSELFDTLTQAYGLKADSAVTSFYHQELVQHQISDWDFLMLRAEANNLLVAVSNGTVKLFHPNMSAEPVIKLNYGSSIMEFDAEIEGRYQWKSVIGTAWDYANQKLLNTETSKANGINDLGNLSAIALADSFNPLPLNENHSGCKTEVELQNWTDSTMQRSRLSKIRGSARVSGFGGIALGDMIEISGIGNRFNGNTLVTGITQEMQKNVWETIIHFGLSHKSYLQSTEDENMLPASALMGGIFGLQIGKVVELESDPNGEDRILVKLPMIDDTANGTWSRIACLDAGNNRGSFFRPEINDEVIVGFINNDPNDAIVLGMLNSSSLPAPLKAQNVNDEKGFFTRSNMRLMFNDNTNTITIDTPKGNKIVMDEDAMQIEIQDQNKNTITMCNAGIKLNSTMNVEIEAAANLSLKAGGTLTISGESLAIKANGNMVIEGGGAFTSLSSAGITEIKGSIVKIN